MRIGIFTRDALTEKHGSGAQLIRILDGAEIPYFHLYWWWGHGGMSDRQPSFRLIAPNWMARKGLFRLFSQIGMTWWKDNRVNLVKLSALRAEHNLQCDVAYCLIGDEVTAARALSLVEAFGCPYVVQFMDLYEDNLNPKTMPAMRRLLAGAKSVLAITGPLENEVARFAPKDVRRVFVGQDTDVPQATPPVANMPVRVLLSGRVYESGLALLVASLPRIRHQFPQIEFTYVGPEYDKFPAGLHTTVKNVGFVADDVYRQTLADSHLAYLMGPLERDWLGKYSFPSRTADYLMAGLPVLGCVGETTATESVLLPLVPLAVQFTRTTESLLEALAAFLEPPAAWQRASLAARAYAVEFMALESVRTQWLQALSAAAAR